MSQRFITGPIVIEPRTQPDGSIRYEVWDNGAFSFHLIETVGTKAEATAVAKKLTDAIARR
jgi:hypothetical protein